MSKTPVQTVKANGIDIAYELIEPKNPNQHTETVLMIQGLGMPLTGWSEDWRKLFLDAGYRILLHDNRDIGCSHKFNDAPPINMMWQWLRNSIGLLPQAPYTLSDMMKDSVGVLEALKIKKAHVIGVSMGGMISQLLAANAPDRILSLTSIMSTTGHKSLSRPDKEIIAQMMKGMRISDPKERLAHSLKTWQMIGSPGYPTSEEDRIAAIMRNAHRGVTPAGVRRQMLAIMASPDRRAVLAGMKVPTLVVHGEDDRLVPIDGGLDTAKAVPGAILRTIKGMGHDLPKTLLPEVFGYIRDHMESIHITA